MVIRSFDVALIDNHEDMLCFRYLSHETREVFPVIDLDVYANYEANLT